MKKANKTYRRARKLETLWEAIVVIGIGLVIIGWAALQR